MLKQRLPPNYKIFKCETPITLTVWFFLPRPNTDFVGGRRQAGNLKPSARTCRAVSVYPDIDNLLKFLLDSLNGIVYEDDKQVAKLISYKVRDNLGLCNGFTQFEVEPFNG